MFGNTFGVLFVTNGVICIVYSVRRFIDEHDVIFVVEQNRDAQMRTLLINEFDCAPGKLVPLTYYAGLSISADFIYRRIAEYYQANKLPRLTEVQ